jgi:hypothetical protein
MTSSDRETGGTPTTPASRIATALINLAIGAAITAILHSVAAAAGRPPAPDRYTGGAPATAPASYRD